MEGGEERLSGTRVLVRYAEREAGRVTRVDGVGGLPKPGKLDMGSKARRRVRLWESMRTRILWR